MLVSSLITVLGLAFIVGILYHYFQGQLMDELKKKPCIFPEVWKVPGRIICSS